jgi:hypothetical protein
MVWGFFASTACRVKYFLCITNARTNVKGPMPAAKSKKVVLKKKVTAKPVAKVMKPMPRMAKNVSIPRSKAKESIWTKQFLMKEQQEFYAAHPNSKILIAVFICALVLFLFIFWTNKADLYPQAFM